MSLLINKDKNEKEKEENGNSSRNYKKEILEEKEEDTSNLTNIKVFNGLIEEDNAFKKLNKVNKNANNNNQNSNKKDIDSYLNENKMIDLNYISFGDCDNLFVNNTTKKNMDHKKHKKESKSKDKKDKSSSHNKSKNKKNKHSHSKKTSINNNIKNIKVQKKSIEELLTNDSNKRPKTMSFNEPNEIKDEKINSNISNNNKRNNEIIERKEKECKNYFKISAIKNGTALVVTGDDVVFLFPAYLLPVGAKLGESFILEVKLFDNNYNKKENEEIAIIQNKYSSATEEDNNK
jgi:hypothetical protein